MTTDFTGFDYDDLIDEELPEGHRSGFVAVIGRPNVGKSTLMNQILRQKIAIVSPKPQTTRIRQLGIFTRDDAQIIFVDTPGLHDPQHNLGAFMVEDAKTALADADVILFLVEVSAPPHPGDQAIVQNIKTSASDVPVILVMNKVDLVDPAHLQANVDAFNALVKPAEWVALSARDGSGIDEVLGYLVAHLPEGPRFYPPEVVSETNLRIMAAEYIREQILLLTRDEVPHGAAVQVEEYIERDENTTYIRATIYVERDTHKGIIIGKSGQMLKRIGANARQELEALTETTVFLELWVKVLKNWRKSESALRRFGYTNR